MTKRLLGLFFVLLLVLRTVDSAQDPAEDKGVVATKLAEGLSPLKAASLEVPKGEAAWSVRMIRTGGFAGRSLDISITSTGEVKCTSPDGPCPKAISKNDLQSLAGLIDSKVLRNSKSTLSDACKDCFVTRITVGQRDEKGKIQTYFAYFDDVTAAKAPFQLVRIATSIAALR
jgi:hypothetical protein